MCASSYWAEEQAGTELELSRPDADRTYVRYLTGDAGAGAYFDRSRPQSIYLAYPGVEAQIEVYDPDAKQALELVDSGQIVPVG